MWFTKTKMGQSAYAAERCSARRQTGITVAVCAAAVVTVLAGLLISDKERAAQTTAAQAATSVETITVRPDSHRLTDVPDGKATFVEFLDFECGACAALYPVVEQLHKDYGDRVTFVVRYLPLSSHPNGERAARAVEAASRQGKFSQMAQRMFDTQGVWGYQKEPQDNVFRAIASELGLDMRAFDTDYNDRSTVNRVRADQSDGMALGINGIPAFFLNGEQLHPQTYKDLTDALDNALK